MHILSKIRILASEHTQVVQEMAGTDDVEVVGGLVAHEKLLVGDQDTVLLKEKNL